MIAMKFGGTSVGSRERLAHMAQLVVAAPPPVVVVVSAMGGTTDRLLAMGAAAERGEDVEAECADLLRIHLEATDDEAAGAATERTFGELRDLLRGISLLREQTPRTQALLVSFGERLSAPIAAAHIRALGRLSEAVDSRLLVRTDDRYDDAAVDREATRALCRSDLLPRLERGVVPVVTGFLGSTEDGITTTLGRGGSDYSGALLGAALDADEVWIWTDVDGILTADPRLVSEARTLGRVSYREAAEMSYFGARVLHPKTMLPARDRDIPIRIRSTFAPEAPGTLVSRETDDVPQGVKTVTTIRSLALVDVDGRGMAGLPGVARRIFGACEEAGTSVVMISQASSEQTVSVVVQQAEAPKLVQSLRRHFELELGAGLIESIDVRSDVAILSIIGDGMAGTPGVSGRLFGALGEAGVNVLAIAQGAKELSISVVVAGDAVARAVRAAHTAFGLTRVVHLALIGCGGVGRTLLAQLSETRDLLDGAELRLVGVANSTRWHTAAEGFDPGTLDEVLAAAGARPSDAALVASLVAERHTDLVVVDCTAAETGALHLAALEAGFHVVTANKLPLAGPMADYRRLVTARDAAHVRYGYETTVGAGLPVLHTVKELLHTGDELHSVLGCLSGTLGFVCTELERGVALDEVVRRAAAAGFTEPDPREDLSGRDVGRKALILARAIGLSLEPDAVHVAPLVDDLELGLDEAVRMHGGALAQRFADAADRGCTLRYVATLADGRAEVGLREVERSGPVGSLQGPDNIVVFHTRRYADHPLVVRGPGAGAEVTAAGVLGDILRVARIGPHR